MSTTRWRAAGAAWAAATLLSGTGFVSALAAEPAPANSSTWTQAPTAAAWVVDASLFSGRHMVQLAEVRASSGGVPSAWAAPVTLDGQGPVDAGANSARPTTSRARIDWHDPSGSITIQGGYGSANVEPTSTSARAGIAAMSGSSFSLASKMLTWNQQQQLTGAVAALNDALVDPLNKALRALAPQLALLGLAVPQVQKMSPVAVINVGSGAGVSASASTGFSPGFSSARAAASASGVQLFDGFVQIDAVHVTANAEDASGAKTMNAVATLGQVRIAGLPVQITDRGVEVLGTVLSRTLLQPVLDQVLHILKSLGITLRLAQTSSRGVTRQATALELDVPTPAGMLALSVGHAEASAPPPPPIPSGPATSGHQVDATSAPAPAPAPVPTSASPSPPTPVDDTGSAVGDDVIADVAEPSTSAAPPGPADSGSGPYSAAATEAGIPAWLGVTLPAAVAKALGGVFLLLLLGGVAMAVVPPMLFTSANRRPIGLPAPRRPILDQEVRP